MHGMYVLKCFDCMCAVILQQVRHYRRACLQPIPLFRSTISRGTERQQKPPNIVKHQPTPTLSMMTCTRAKLAAANVQRTKLQDARAVDTWSSCKSTRSVFRV